MRWKGGRGAARIAGHSEPPWYYTEELMRRWTRDPVSACA